MTGLAAKVAVPAVVQTIPWKLIGWCALGFTLVAMLFALRLEQSQNAKLKSQLHECTTLRVSDRQSYEKAQQDAAALNKVQVQKIEQQYQRNSDDERQAYLDDLAKLRAGSVRTHPKASPGSTDPASPPAPVGTAQGADGAGEVRLSPEEFLRAQEIELQLMHLEAWVNKQVSVDPNTLREPPQ